MGNLSDFIRGIGQSILLLIGIIIVFFLAIYGLFSLILKLPTLF